MYFVKATQIWKNNLLRFLEASKRNEYFQILWPSQNISTLNSAIYRIFFPKFKSRVHKSVFKNARKNQM